MFVSAFLWSVVAQPPPAARPKPPEVRQAKGKPLVVASGMAGPMRTADSLEVETTRMQLLSFDKAAYEVGATAKVLVSLENIGDKPIKLPWTLDYRTRSLAVDVLLRLRLLDSSEVVLGISLYGNKADASTYRLLNPGATAEILVPIKLDPASLSRFYSQSKSEVSVIAKAHYDFFYGAESWTYSRNESANEMTITIKKKGL